MKRAGHELPAELRRPPARRYPVTVTATWPRATTAWAHYAGDGVAYGMRSSAGDARCEAVQRLPLHALACPHTHPETGRHAAVLEDGRRSTPPAGPFGRETPRAMPSGRGGMAPWTPPKAAHLALSPLECQENP